MLLFHESHKAGCARFKKSESQTEVCDVHLLLPLLLVLFFEAHLHCRTYAVHMNSICPLYASLAAFLLIIGTRAVNC